MEDTLDFGHTPWMGFRTKPHGLIGVQFNSEYMLHLGQPVPKKLSEDVSEFASIIRETRHRVLIATGDMLCDRETYDVYTDGSVEATFASGELSAALEVEDDSDDEEFIDKTGEIFWLDEPSPQTPTQLLNNDRLEELGDLIVRPDTSPESRALAHAAIKKIENSGETDFIKRLDTSEPHLRNILSLLKLMEPNDYIGQIHPITTVDC